jgi:hypothetical protein
MATPDGVAIQRVRGVSGTPDKQGRCGMERVHDGMNVTQRRLLQFWLDAHPRLREVYEELNGELPAPEYGCENELDGHGRDVDAMPSVDAWLDQPTEEV